MNHIDKIHFYYIRDYDERRPIITVAIAEDNEGTVCRGVSICSYLDQPVKARGRAIAEGRLRKAFFNGESSEPIRNALRLAEEITDMKGEPIFEFKSGYDVEATEFELGLLDPDFRVDSEEEKEYDDLMGF